VAITKSLAVQTENLGDHIQVFAANALMRLLSNAASIFIDRDDGIASLPGLPSSTAAWPREEAARGRQNQRGSWGHWAPGLWGPHASHTSPAARRHCAVLRPGPLRRERPHPAAGRHGRPRTDQLSGGGR